MKTNNFKNQNLERESEVTENESFVALNFFIQYGLHCKFIDVYQHRFQNTFLLRYVILISKELCIDSQYEQRMSLICQLKQIYIPSFFNQLLLLLSSVFVLKLSASYIRLCQGEKSCKDKISEKWESLKQYSWVITK